jgi:hypothetical protein
LLQIFYCIGSNALLIEQLDDNLLFRWCEGLQGARSSGSGGLCLFGFDIPAGCRRTEHAGPTL